MREYQEAIESFDKAIEINPKNANVWNIKGNSFYAIRKYQEAIDSYDKAIEINPNYAEAWYNKGIF
jgi:tetratricopeptide (TPR) repeat protein